MEQKVDSEVHKPMSFHTTDQTTKDNLEKLKPLSVEGIRLRATVNVENKMKQAIAEIREALDANKEEFFNDCAANWPVDAEVYKFIELSARADVKRVHIEAEVRKWLQEQGAPTDVQISITYVRDNAFRMCTWPPRKHYVAP